MLLFILSLICAFSFGQDSPTNQIELSHDNDFILLTDRYYSSGLFVSYRKKLTKGLFRNDSEQLDFKLGQEVYTPKQTQSINSAVFDRPYAGFLGLHTRYSFAKKNQLFETTLLLGLAGVNSGAGGFQRWYHKVIAISDSPLWIDELQNSFHTNIYGSYTKEWELAPVPFGIRMALKPSFALGTRDVFIAQEAIAYFGRRNAINTSIANHRLGSQEREIFFALRAGLKYVLHNGLIEGNLFGDSSPVVKTPENILLLLGFDFYHRFNKNDYKVGLRFNSRETGNAKVHKYIQLAYALSF